MSEHKKNVLEILLKWSPLILVGFGLLGGYYALKFTVRTDHETLGELDKTVDTLVERVAKLEGAEESRRRWRNSNHGG